MKAQKTLSGVIIVAYINGIATQSGLSGGPTGFKKSKLENSLLYFSDYSGGIVDTAIGSGTTVTKKASTQGGFTIKEFPRPTAGASSSSVTTLYDSSDSSSLINYNVNRID